MLTSTALPEKDSEVSREAHLSTPSYPPASHAWLSCPDGDQKWPEGVECAPPQGPSSFDGVCLQEVAVDFPRETFGRANRLTRRADYSANQSRGRRVHLPHFVVQVLEHEAAPTRLGMTVPKRTVGTGVARNRVKRLVREVFRRNRDLFPLNSDVVFVARAGAENLTYAEVLAEVAGLKSGLAKAVKKGMRDGARG